MRSKPINPKTRLMICAKTVSLRFDVARPDHVSTPPAGRDIPVGQVLLTAPHSAMFRSPFDRFSPATAMTSLSMSAPNVDHWSRGAPIRRPPWRTLHAHVESGTVTDGLDDDQRILTPIHVQEWTPLRSGWCHFARLCR